MTMIERAALAMEARRRELIAQPLARLWPELARAAIQAMREPTEEMTHGARDWSRAKYGIPVGSDASTGCWHSMIDAALSEKQGGR